MRSFRHVATVVMAPLLAGACVSTAVSGPASPSPGTGMTAAEIEALYHARTDSLRMRFTETDVQFINGMIHHHVQALQMAALTPERTTNQSIRVLSARIINAQQDEIALMQNWLRNRGLPVPEVHTMDGRVMVHGADHAHHAMPGMLTDEQMKQLEAARGEEYDRLLLTFMIQHHRGAVVMVHDLFRTDGAGQDEDVFRFAADVQVDQSTEIARMELMLSGMTGGGPPP